jgi:hypothetical protein
LQIDTFADDELFAVKSLAVGCRFETAAAAEVSSFET